MTLHVKLAEPGGEPLACACGEGAIPDSGDGTARVVAAWLRQELGPHAEICVAADGRVSFAREPQAPRTWVRGVRG